MESSTKMTHCGTPLILSILPALHSKCFIRSLDNECPTPEKYEKLIISLRTAQAKKYSSDEKQISNDDKIKECIKIKSEMLSLTRIIYSKICREKTVKDLNLRALRIKDILLGLLILVRIQISFAHFLDNPRAEQEWNH